MKNVLRSLIAGILMCGVALVQAATMPKLEQPILLTSLGQAADVHTMSVLAKRAKMPLDYKTFATGEEAANYKTVFVVVGVSLKGFGSAGVNLETETARANAIFENAKKAGAYVVVVHIGGSERRDQMSNKLLDVAVPHADAFIVYEQGNADGYFTKAAGDKPIVLLPKTTQLIKTLSELM